MWVLSKNLTCLQKPQLTDALSEEGAALCTKDNRKLELRALDCYVSMSHGHRHRDMRHKAPDACTITLDIVHPSHVPLLLAS